MASTGPPVETTIIRKSKSKRPSKSEGKWKMINAPKVRNLRLGKATNTECIEWLKRGWNDFRQGNPFPKEYESLRPVLQRNYENGRLRGANVKCAGLKLTSWNAEKLPSTLLGTWRRAIDLVGPCQPKSLTE